MRWPWQQVIQPNRPTVTFMDDVTIVGLPGDITQERAHVIQEGLRAWAERDPKPALILLPFPVDIFDKRTRR